MFNGNRNLKDRTGQERKHGEAFCDRQQGTRSLWIICPDAVMETALHPVRELSDAMIVRRHLHGSNESPGDLRFDIIKFAEDSVRYRGVRDIVICANSLCSDFHEHMGSATLSSHEDPMDIILRGVRNREKHNQSAKQRLLQDLRNLTNRPAIADAIDRQELNIHGLYYLAESGILLLFDKSRECFIPLKEI